MGYIEDLEDWENQTISSSDIVIDGTLSTVNTISAYDPINFHPDSMIFAVDDEVIEFRGIEIKRLKQMLNSWIKENHPEDLL